MSDIERRLGGMVIAVRPREDADESIVAVGAGDDERIRDAVA